MQQIQADYRLIKDDCVITTACDSKHAPYLVNALNSIVDNFPDHPRIVIYNLGLTKLECNELRQFSAVEVHKVDKFVSHWKINWSWKLYALSQKIARFNLYLDMPNFVVLRNLSPWFISIKKNGYFLVSNEQILKDITPNEYWNLFSVDRVGMENLPTFGAGIIGFDSESKAAEAIAIALQGVSAGLNLGRSKDESNRRYKPNIIRSCPCFRADQTLINIAFRKFFHQSLNIRRSPMYCGTGRKDEHFKQYLWYSRRGWDSLTYLKGRKNSDPVEKINYFYWLIRIRAVRIIKLLLNFII